MADSTSPTSGQSISQVKTPAELATTAAQQVDSAINGQTAPLQSQIGVLNAQGQEAQADIGNMFSSILPFAANAASQVKQGYDAAQQGEQNIFTQATTNMNQLKQDAAARAQALAQQIGGPVSVSDFTDPFEVNQVALNNLGAGQILHTLGMAQAGEQEAQTFAGGVLPLIQTEQQANARTQTQNNVKQLQDQISQLKSTRGSQINSTLNDLLQQERSYQLSKQSADLQKLQATRDWQSTKETLANDTARVRLAQQQFGETKNQQAIANKMNQQKLSDQEQQWGKQYGLSNEQLQFNIAQATARTSLAKQQLKTSQNQTYAQYLDSAINGTVGKTITSTVPVQVSDLAATTGKIKDAYKGKDGHYYHLVTTKQTLTTSAISDPDQLYNYLRAHNVPITTAKAMIRSRLSLGSDWQPKAKKK